MLDSPTAIITAVVAVFALIVAIWGAINQRQTADRQHDQQTSMAYRTELQDEVNERRTQVLEMRDQLITMRSELATCRTLCDACESKAVFAQNKHDQTVYELRGEIAVLRQRIQSFEVEGSV